MIRLGLFASLLTSASASALLVVAACSSSSSSAVIAPDDGGSEGSIPVGEGGAGDAGADTSSPASTCEGACKTTSLVGDFGGKKRTLVRAQFGTQQGDAGAELHTESHLGGTAACPTQQSPTPDYTLIVSAVPRGAAGRKLKETDGVTSAFFDFKGDLGLAQPSGISKALSVNVTVVAEDTATPPSWVALDVTVGFTEGSIKGHLYAEYCASLSE